MLRMEIVDAWKDGKTLVFRMGHSTPDFMLGLNSIGMAFNGASMRPGPATEDAKKLLKKKDRPDTFTIHDNFQFVFTSCFNMDDWKGYLRGKIPMGELQPVQMCASLEQVAEVMQNGLPKGANLDDDLSEMDRLADML